MREGSQSPPSLNHLCPPWLLQAYNLTAGFFTKAGSGSMRRHSSADTLLTGASRG